jgi:hypothetical protein
LTPVVPQRAEAAGSSAPAGSAPVALTAQVQALPRPTAFATLQPVSLLGQQVNFHVGFLVDFVVTGAGLFGRELAIPGTLTQDIQNGTPVPIAVGRALQTFAQIELEAGQRLVGFAAEYVNFQVQFLTNLLRDVITTVGNTTMAFATFAVRVVSQLVSSVAPGPAPATNAAAFPTSAAPTAVVTTPRVTDIAKSRTPVDTAIGSSGDAVGAASTAHESAPAKKPKPAAERDRGAARSENHTDATDVADVHQASASTSGTNAGRIGTTGDGHRQHEPQPNGDRRTHDGPHGTAGDST